MAVRHDYECLKCEEIFTAWSDDIVCPECKSVKAQIVFLTPPGTRSVTTANSDAIVKDLVDAYGIGDFNNNPSTMHEGFVDPKLKQQYKPIEMSTDIKLKPNKSGMLQPSGDIQKVYNQISAKMGNVRLVGSPENALSRMPQLPSIKSVTHTAGACDANGNIIKPFKGG